MYVCTFRVHHQIQQTDFLPTICETGLSVWKMLTVAVGEKVHAMHGTMVAVSLLMS